MATAPATVTFKKADATTDIVYTLMSSSGGDKSPAVYRSLSTTGTAGQHPELRIMTMPSGDLMSRKGVVNYTFPSVYTDANTGLTQVQSRANATLSFSIPLGMKDVDILEFGAQMGNFFNQSVLRTVYQTGYAPT